LNGYRVFQKPGSDCGVLELYKTKITDHLEELLKVRKAGVRANFLLLFVMAVVLALTASCAPLKTIGSQDFEPMKQKQAEPERGWWHARFIVDWPRDQAPAWHMDLLLAHKVVLPVLCRYKNDIVLWRFHRRAVRDQTGHQFSFIFYSTPDIASHVFRSLKADENLRLLKVSGVIEDHYDDTNQIARPAIEDVSDRKWSLPIQKSWPYFIMGVSQMWLELITEIAQDESKVNEPSATGDLQEFYRRVNDAVKESWQAEGGHALLHHLNALFGYEPVVIYEKKMMNF
jgi:hypothetical protein